MKEVKTPKKPLAIYYAIVLLVLMLLNFVLVPWMNERQIKEVDYGTFMSMTEEKDIGHSIFLDFLLLFLHLVLFLLFLLLLLYNSLHFLHCLLL